MNSQKNAAQCFKVVTAQGKPLKLVMQELSLTGHVLPVGARLIVRHVFCSSEPKPVEAVYAFGLPRDAALRQFRIQGKDFEVHSELHDVKKATEIYEAGIQDGSLSALARQYGDGLVNLSIGNLRPDEEVSVFLEILAGVENQDDEYRFRFPFSLAPSYHSTARMAEAEPGVGEIELPEDRFGDLLLPKFRRSSERLHQIGFELTVESPGSNTEVGSPSHAIRVRPEGKEMLRISNGRDGEVPNRDLIIDVRHSAAEPMVFTGLDKQNRGQLAAEIPASCIGVPTEEPISVVMLLDRSGSMSGPPIQQARKAAKACLAALSPEDNFGIVLFDDSVNQFMPNLLQANKQNRNSAHKFLKKYEARGGTELRKGLLSARSLFNRPGGDLLVITDGQVFETESILEEAREMGHRVHVLGIGSASQDRFLALLARETGGTSRFLTARERVDLGALELFSAIGNPVAEGIKLSSTGSLQISTAPEPPSHAFTGSPLVVWGESNGPGSGLLELTWKKPKPGSINVPFRIPEVTVEIAETLRLLRGARLLTDLDSRVVSGRGAERKRQVRRIEERMRKLSEEFQLASRQKALVAVLRREGDKPGKLPATRIVPVGMPEDVAFGNYFGDFAEDWRVLSKRIGSVPTATLGLVSAGEFRAPAQARSLKFTPTLSKVREFFSAGPESSEELEMQAITQDPLVELAALVEPDGGMPGASLVERALRTLLTLLCFRAEERARQRSIFKRHAKKMTAFMKSLDLDRISDVQQSRITLGLQLAEDPLFEWNDWLDAAKQLAGKKKLKESQLEQLLAGVIDSHAISSKGV